MTREQTAAEIVLRSNGDLACLATVQLAVNGGSLVPSTDRAFGLACYLAGLDALAVSEVDFARVPNDTRREAIVALQRARDLVRGTARPERYGSRM